MLSTLRALERIGGIAGPVADGVGDPSSRSPMANVAAGFTATVNPSSRFLKLALLSVLLLMRVSMYGHSFQRRRQCRTNMFAVET